MKTPTVKPIELLSLEAATTLRVSLMTRQAWIQNLYPVGHPQRHDELADLVILAEELGIADCLEVL